MASRYVRRYLDLLFDVSLYTRAIANSGRSSTVRWHMSKAHDSAVSMAVACLQLILMVSHAAAGCPGASSSQRAAFRLGGFWHPPSGRCGVDTTTPDRFFRRRFWGHFPGSNCAAALLDDRTSQGTPLSTPVRTWRPDFADACFRCPSPPIHRRVVRNCEVAPKSEPASRKHGRSVFLLSRRAAHTFPAAPLQSGQDRTPKHTQTKLRTVQYRFKPPPVSPCAFFLGPHPLH